MIFSISLGSSLIYSCSLSDRDWIQTNGTINHDDAASAKPRKIQEILLNMQYYQFSDPKFSLA